MMTDVPASQDVPDATEVFGGGPLLEKQAPIRNYRFTSEKGTPVLMPAFMHQEMDCGWMGVGGQVFDANEQPVIDLVVLLQGTLNGEIVNLFALTGTATAFGPGGYEFMLADHPVPSENTLYIGLYDSYGNKLSSDIYISTSELCESNLVLVNFKEFYFEDGASVLVPLIIR